MHVSLGNVGIHLEQPYGLWSACHHQVAQVLSQSVDKEQRVKPFVPNFLVDEQCLWHVATQECFVEAEVVVIVQNVEVVNSVLVGDIAVARSEYLVKD